MRRAELIQLVPEAATAGEPIEGETYISQHLTDDTNFFTLAVACADPELLAVKLFGRRIDGRGNAS